MPRIVALLFVLTLTIGVPARTGASELPEPVALAQPNLALVGQGTFTWFVFRVYDAWLWAPEGRWAPDDRYVLDLRYARDLRGDAIAAQSVEEMRKLGVADEQLDEWAPLMQAAFPDVGDGDRLTGEFVPGGATRFYFNGILQAEIEDPEFGPAFSAIWLAPDTSAPRLRRALLAGNDDAG